MSEPSPFEANAYAVTYRLLGDASAAHAAAHAAVGALERARERDAGSSHGRHWLYSLTDFAVAEAVASPAATGAGGRASVAARGADGSDVVEDASAGLRGALRRRAPAGRCGTAGHASTVGVVTDVSPD